MSRRTPNLYIDFWQAAEKLQSTGLARASKDDLHALLLLVIKLIKSKEKP